MRTMIHDDNKFEADFLSDLCEKYRATLNIRATDFDRYHIKRGLRNDDGTGVMAGLTQVCSVDGYYIEDGERVPRDGRPIAALIFTTLWGRAWMKTVSVLKNSRFCFCSVFCPQAHSYSTSAVSFHTTGSCPRHSLRTLS